MRPRLLVGDCLGHLREMEADSIDAVVTDPPYGLSAPPDTAEVLRHWLAGEEYEHGSAGFMGRDWDSFVPGPRVWREVLRVLKPGGHAVVFAGTRTVDLMGIAVRLAGWEVRDCGQWCYWSGFPKSLDLSKEMDRMRPEDPRVREITAWIAMARDQAGFTNADLDRPFGFAGMAGHWTTTASQPTIPTPEQWTVLARMFNRAGVDVPGGIHDAIEDLNGVKRTWGNERPDRETEHVDRSVYRSAPHVVDPGTPVTDNARRWSGWGTALKPAVEPWLLLRKPISESSIARNVLRWGTGGLNIDACRFAPGDPMWPGPSDDSDKSRPGNMFRGVIYGDGVEGQSGDHPLGRFPANLIHTPKASRAEREMGCDGLPTRTGAEATHREEGTDGLKSPRAGAGRTAKGVRNHHPTVKPLALMRWLVRLVTPPGGVVLDPFMGSGTTGMAAVGQGFDFVGMELEADHMQIARARIEYAAAGPVECDLEDVREPVAQLPMWGAS